MRKVQKDHVYFWFKGHSGTIHMIKEINNYFAYLCDANKQLCNMDLCNKSNLIESIKLQLIMWC